ncbi:IclR family transcriptional regulator C-terminal domain-containing protein [Streptomyces sp. TLI_146]|uniref:IclR family transcriptional regulator domain-containing protein n=1 Tax=Streptomyces sp. TLI_146 TaxID=1938858 RepID=UPI000C7154D5|nr:transcriptional regulator [Streptomyces sp. TLI_146]
MSGRPRGVRAARVAVAAVLPGKLALAACLVTGVRPPGWALAGTEALVLAVLLEAWVLRSLYVAARASLASTRRAEPVAGLACARGPPPAPRPEALLQQTLSGLRDAAGAAVYISSYTDGEVTISQYADGPTTPKVHEWVDFRAAAHASAVGKSLLAQLDFDSRMDHLSRRRPVRLTSRTITDHQACSVPWTDTVTQRPSSTCSSTPPTKCAWPCPWQWVARPGAWPCLCPPPSSTGSSMQRVSSATAPPGFSSPCSWPAAPGAANPPMAACSPHPTRP